ncbi:FAD binding domain-containing protein [Hirsutella rhossiliensis]|uniref:FAD binding domain-containing protein n=1 Tax=Hirsutella rhossiliensis TaxID=111463 RepID=A0A9P8MXX3_9HYPO|nr:FAD binding domain-containing protein [Hirsutella rhossiliensis]KAH0963295.1 FAD binding domain-containing protein [Hirsutella rhossiliensis]
MRDEKCDLLIVGSGATGLAAAAASRGLNTLIVEQAATVGGTSSYSGGCVWIPGNSVTRKQGVRDSPEQGRLHLDALLGAPRDDQPESSSARRDAFLHAGPNMVSLLTESGFKWTSERSTYPDYHPYLPGACPAGGRTLDPAVVNISPKLLGPWTDYVAYSTKPPVARFQDFATLTRPLSSLGTMAKVWWMVFKSKLAGLVGSPVCMGSSLVAQLLSICWRNGNVRIYRDTELIRLETENGVVVGGVLQQGDIQVRVRASAVLLATAGFSRNQEMRDLFLPKPTSVTWSLSNPCGDTGSALRLCKPLEAASASLDKVWGISTMRDPATGTVTNCCFEMARPYSIAVNQSGNRFVCESAPYGDIVDISLCGGKSTARTWLIMDWNYRKRYNVGMLPPRAASTSLMTAGSIAELACKMEVPAANLESTVSRWNAACETGEDQDFGRGGDAYQRFIGDPNVRPNPNMGPISLPPYSAVEIYPGDAGTRGGLLTDEHARVVKTDGSVIQGLYAAGNASASIVTGGAPGAGGTLGPAMTFAYIAVDHVRQTIGKQH